MSADLAHQDVTKKTYITESISNPGKFQRSLNISCKKSHSEKERPKLPASHNECETLPSPQSKFQIGKSKNEYETLPSPKLPHLFWDCRISSDFSNCVWELGDRLDIHSDYFQWLSDLAMFFTHSGHPFFTSFQTNLSLPCQTFHSHCGNCEVFFQCSNTLGNWPGSILTCPGIWLFTGICEAQEKQYNLRMTMKSFKFPKQHQFKTEQFEEVQD